MCYLLNFQRPRRVGAKFTGDDIKPDEKLQPELSFDYDGKRDRLKIFRQNPLNNRATSAKIYTMHLV